MFGVSTRIAAIFLVLSHLAIFGNEFVTIAILAKDKSHTLPIFLQCIENQTWPKSRTYLYVRTNNNNDNTVEILEEWLFKVQSQYAGIYFDSSDIDTDIQQYGQHEWNGVRFKLLGRLRYESVVWAHAHNSNYFVVDCDNFIKPETLSELMALHLQVVAPLLILKYTYYANFHAAIDNHGYLKDTPLYKIIYDRQLQGLIQVPVIHCTYLIRKETLPYVWYDDQSGRYEYVIFSDVLRQQNIPQYLDNRKYYGYVTFAESTEEFQAQDIFQEINNWFK